MDTVNQGEYKGDAAVDLDEAVGPHVKPHTHANKQSCEDVFGEFQGKLVFLEDPDTPTIDEWSDV